MFLSELTHGGVSPYSTQSVVNSETPGQGRTVRPGRFDLLTTDSMESTLVLLSLLALVEGKKGRDTRRLLAVSRKSRDTRQECSDPVTE